jgi:hypothetical protein
VYSTITRTQSSPAVYCVLSTRKQELQRRDKRNYSELCYAPWTATCIWKSRCLRTDVNKIIYPNFLNKEPFYGELLRPFISVLYRSQKGAGLVRTVSRLSYRLADPGFEIREGKRFFSFPKTSRPALGPIQHPVQCILRSLPLGVNRPGRKGYNTYLVSR